MHIGGDCARIIRSMLRFYLEVINLSKHYGHLIRILHWSVDQAMTQALEEMDLTAAQGHIMGYLAHRPEPPCLRDIEEAFHLSHPTVSGLISRLAKKGFIEFRPDENDRRVKRIYILPKGRECHELIRQTIAKNEQRIVQDFTDEERQQFSALLERAIRNMGCAPCNHPPKEEQPK